MRVRHERPMSELEYMVRAPLHLTLVGGKSVTIERWSLNSLMYPDEVAVLPKVGALSVPFQGVFVSFDVKFEEGDEPGELVFKDLSGRQRETLAVFYRSILSGKMASTDDMITSLDTPVDLVPMGETEEEETKGKAKEGNRLLRVLWNVAFYLVFAAVVFGTIGSQIFNRLSHVTLDHARIVAPIVDLNAPEGAFVDRVLVDEGDVVERGDTLVRLSNPELEADLEDVREDIAYQERLVEEATERLVAHRQDVELDRDPYRLAFLRAVEAREVKDFASMTRLQDVYATWSALNRYDRDFTIGSHPLAVRERQLTAELEEMETKLSRLRRDLGNIKDSLTASDIVATSDGVVVTVNAFEDQFIARGQNAVQLEEDAPRVIQAWLNEARSDAIYVGMKATVRFGGGSQSRSADVTISDITARIDPTISDEFGLVVTATFNDMTLEETRDQLRIDAPATLRAIKDWGRRWSFEWL